MTWFAPYFSFVTFIILLADILKKTRITSYARQPITGTTPWPSLPSLRGLPVERRQAHSRNQTTDGILKQGIVYRRGNRKGLRRTWKTAHLSQEDWAWLPSQRFQSAGTPATRTRPKNNGKRSDHTPQSKMTWSLSISAFLYLSVILRSVCYTLQKEKQVRKMCQIRKAR